MTVDTLRYDRLSGLGHNRPTSPNIDALMRRSVVFEQMRVVEPLTAPSMVSLWTSLHPHQHGATRNGLRMRPRTPSLSKILADRGYRTAAFVGNWTLKDELSGLGEHFTEYQEIVSRRRWFGLLKGEATADDLNAEATDWLREHAADAATRDYPFLLWVHYTEPHAPYRMRDEFADRLRISDPSNATAEQRYDSEIAFVDRAIGELLEEVNLRSSAENTLVVFASDHGESLGEHGYWGHGRHLYEPTLRIPASISWHGRLQPKRIADTASSLDLAPTLLGLLGLRVPEAFGGHDWRPQWLDGVASPEQRVTLHQAHKGAVQRRDAGDQARRQGLLEVGAFTGGKKEILRVKGQPQRWVFDLVADAAELRSSVESGSTPSAGLSAWLDNVRAGLESADELPQDVLDEESIEQLRALGYIE